MSDKSAVAATTPVVVGIKLKPSDVERWEKYADGQKLSTWARWIVEDYLYERKKESKNEVSTN